MKKYLFRILVGLLAFGIGVSAVWTFWLKNTQYCEVRNFKNEQSEKVKIDEQIENVKTAFPTSKNGKIGIYFKGFTKGEDGTVVDIEITNNSPKIIYYWSVSKGFIDTHVEFNGTKSKPIAICGNVAAASKYFQLLSGETIKTTMPLDRMKEFVLLKKQNKVRLGYYFSLAKNKDSQIFWSEKNELPKWVEKELGKIY